jgi:HlyD family secretion protein
MVAAAVAGALAAALAVAALVHARLQPEIRYITTPVVRGDLVQTVTASDTVNPQDLILVGTQVSGTILEIDADYNSVVKTGQVLARIDPTSLQAQLAAAGAAEAQSRDVAAAGAAAAGSAEANAASARESIAAARAALASAQSQVGKSAAALDLARLTLHRDRLLLVRGFVPQAQADADAANLAAMDAADAAARIAIRQAQAQLDVQGAAARASESQAQSAAASASANGRGIEVQHEATRVARYNRDHSVIVSPVDGTVIQRNVSVGQTVAASLQTPTLFTVARDLSKMEVDVAVGEPDIGGVRAGDVADFTVLAYPNRTFHGTVDQVRQNPTTVNNVVTYDTVVYVRNADGALLPGMTAAASIHVAKVRHGLIVPVAALQYAPQQTERARTTAPSTATRSPWGTTDAALTRTIVAGRDGRVFVVRDGAPARVAVHVLLVSNTQAAVAPAGARLVPGDRVAVADSSTQIAAEAGAPKSALAVPQAPQIRPGGATR